jgi:hypothetical protein
MNKMKKIILSLSLTFILISLIGCTLGAPQPKLTLDEQNVDIYIGDTYEIKPILENSSNKLIYEIIEGNDYISLEENIITALEEGTAVIEITVESLLNLKAEL